MSELAVTASRLDDDVRRDLSGGPVAWSLDLHGHPLDDELRAWIGAAGDVVLPPGFPGPDEAPRLWFPCVLVRVARSADGLGEPPGALRAAVTIGIVEDARPPSGPTNPAWDVLVTTRDAAVAAIARPARTRACEAQLHALAAEILRPPTPALRHSVVVCTYRRPALLARVLESLASQSVAPETYEVLVVNNDPADDRVRDRVAAARSGPFGRGSTALRLVQCPLPGLPFARNAGIAQARGELVHFLDDDAIARRDWLERLRDTFARHPEAGVVGGRITLERPDPPPRWARPGWAKYWGERATELTAPITARHWWDYPWGGNWSARRTVLVAIGGFRSGYGRLGTNAAGGEEIVAAALVERLGNAVVVDPGAEVIHAPEPERFTLAHVWRRIQAAKREEYRQERDGYLPPATTLRSTAWSVGRHLRRACARRGLASHERLEHLMYACAEARLLGPLLRDAAPRP